jgi:hypothetical protein
MKPSAQAVVATLIAVLLSGTAFGQTKSDEPVKTVRISGRVTDAVGAPVADAAVVVKLAGTNDTTASATLSMDLQGGLRLAMRERPTWVFLRQAQTLN